MNIKNRFQPLVYSFATTFCCCERNVAIILRLPAGYAELLIEYGAFLGTEVGFPGWTNFNPFRLRVDSDVG
jgi:hypothetical protein